MDTESPRLRLSILGIVVFSLFAALFARLYYLQVMATDQGEVEAAANRVRIIQEEAPRGRILDVKGRVIVDNRTSLEVTIDRHLLDAMKQDERRDLLLRLAEQLTDSGIPTKVATLERRLEDPQYNPLQPIPVAIDVPEDLMVYLAERADEFPGVQLRRESVRHYPEGSLAAHVVGYVGRINADELTAKMGTKDEPKLAPKPYEPDSNIGKTGIEKTFEDDLRGTPGKRTVEVDRNGKVVRELKDQYKAPVAGSDVQLTIDMDVQKVAERSLADQLESLRGRYTRDGRIAQGKAGSSVVEDPRNGHIVAMASYPTYDPTEFVNGISSDRYQQLVGGEAADNPLTNRAIGGLYAPGSTFKLVTAYAGLSKGVITPNETYVDGGVYRVGNRDFQNAERAVNGPVNMSSAITVSSDVYFYRLGDLFWAKRDQFGDGIQESARGFGFGQETGIQVPDELAGVVPDPAWKKQRFETYPEDVQKSHPDDARWFAGDNVNLAIGQGDMLATPLQMANSYATFADHGVRHQTSVVLRVLKPGADPNDPAIATCNPADASCPVARRIDDVVAGQINLPSEWFDPIREGLGGVTSSPRGTAYELFKGFDQSSWPVMGKTGTAQVNNKADTSLFVGVGPANDPQYVAVAVLEASGFGADAAGPVVRDVFELASGSVDVAGCPGPNAPSTTTTTVYGVTPPNCPQATTTTTAPSTPSTYTPTYTVPTTAYTPPRVTTPTTAYRPPTTVAPTTRAPTVSTTVPPTVASTPPSTKKTG